MRKTLSPKHYCCNVCWSSVSSSTNNWRLFKKSIAPWELAEHLISDYRGRTLFVSYSRCNFRLFLPFYNWITFGECFMKGNCSRITLNIVPTLDVYVSFLYARLNYVSSLLPFLYCVLSRYVLPKSIILKSCLLIVMCLIEDELIWRIIRWLICTIS